MRIGRGLRGKWGWGGIALVFLLLLPLLWGNRISLLRRAGEAWRKNEALVGGAGAIVILGGDVETRPFRAAELFHQGVAPRIWVLQHEREPTSVLGLTPGKFQLTLDVLRRLNVPGEALEVVGENLTSTWDEALAVRKRILAGDGIQCIILPTDPFHTRRTDWLFTTALRETGVDVRVVPVTPRDYDPERWWESEAGFLAFHNEVAKYFYYRLKFWGGGEGEELGARPAGSGLVRE